MTGHPAPPDAVLVPLAASLGYEVCREATALRGTDVPAGGPDLVFRTAGWAHSALSPRLRKAALRAALAESAACGHDGAHLRRWMLAMHMISEHQAAAMVAPGRSAGGAAHIHALLHQLAPDGGYASLGTGRRRYDHPEFSRQFSPEGVEAVLTGCEQSGRLP